MEVPLNLCTFFHIEIKFLLFKDYLNNQYDCNIRVSEL